jgi:hypothetical protein
MMNNNKLWKELIRLLSAEGQPTKAVLVQTCTAVLFHSFSVWYNFCNGISSKIAYGQPRTTILETLIYKTARRHSPQDHNRDFYYSENLKSSQRYT